MNILITGGAGFIGSTLADRLLSEGKRVVVIDNFDDYYDVKLKEQNIEEALKNPNYKLYKNDICDEKALDVIFRDEKPDVVVHLAACAGVRASFENPFKYITTNILGTVNILEKMKEYGIKKIVFASSSSVYGNCDADIFGEDLKLSEPISPYAATKLAGEQFIYTYSKSFGINAVCLRLFTVYGERQRPDLAIRKFAQLIKQNEPIDVYGDGTTFRDYTYIGDIVDGIESAMFYDKTPYEIINLGGGNPVRLDKMIEILEDVMGQRAKVNRLPVQIGDVEKTASDITKAKNLLNYNPKTSLKEGIAKFIEWLE